MDQRMSNIAEELIKNNIKPSVHRMRVLEYLVDKKNHPTVDEIYTSLKHDCPTLSKATVYNTLNLLVEVGLVKALTIEDKEVRYDYTKENHGHFKCQSCGTVCDFEANIDQLCFKGLENCIISNKDVYFKGICSKCLLNKKM